MTSKARKPARATALNVYTMAYEIGLTADGRLRDVEPTSAAGIRRCINAGLLESAGKLAGRRGYVWRVTAKGLEALLAAPRSCRRVAAAIETLAAPG